MSITWPTLDDLKERYRAWYRAFFPNVSTAKGSDAWLESQAMGLLGYIVMARAKAIYADIFVTTASGDALDTHAEVLLPPDKRRQAASGTTAGSVKFWGTSGTSIPVNTELVDAAGNRFRTSEAVAPGDWVAGPPAYATVDVVGISTGQSCNHAVGEHLTLVSPISGVDDESEVSTALTGARDQEKHEELRARLLSWLRYPPSGGNWGHYKNYAEGVGACTKAYVYPLYRGLGTVDVVCMGPGIDEDNPTGDRFSVDTEAVWDVIDEEVRPATADIGVRPDLVGTKGITVPTAQAEPVDVDIDPAADYKGDWSGSFTATAMPSTTRIEVSADPGSLTPGEDRILINVQVGGVWVPCVRTVAAVTSGPPHYIDVTEALPSTTPDTTAGGIMPAGPGTQAQVDAILALFDRLTPGDAVVGDGRRPEPSPEHPTDLYVSEIVRALKSLASVADISVTTPAANVTPTAAKYLIRNERVYITYV
jgi:uncharacterized phage protein gp47/JayE